MLVGLAGITPNDPSAPRPSVAPFRAHCMGAVFNHFEIMRLRQSHQSIHIDNMPAHVRQHQNVGLIGLGRQILKINYQSFRYTNKDRYSTNRGNGPGHRRQCESIGQNPIARLHAQRAQRSRKRIATRGHGKAIARAHLRGKLLLQKCGLRHFIRRLVVAMQPPVQHDCHGRLDRFVQNGFLLGEVTREYLCHSAGFGLAASKVNPLLPTMSQTDQNLYACRAGLRLREKPI